MPFSLVFGLIVRVRGFLYRRGLFARTRLPKPVVVVGNLTVGGTGKTPLVIALARQLVSRGLRVGVVSRGYGVRAREARRIEPTDSPAVAGDEPLMIARQTGCPVAIGARRAAAAALLLEDVDVLLCDDGLQHYALCRDLEILVIDGERGFGNGWLLPAGPLREGRGRLGSVDYVVVNGPGGPSGAMHMQVVLGDAVELASGTRRPLSQFDGTAVHAVAGIGHPERFFAALRARGLAVTGSAFADHADYRGGEFEFGDGLPVLMTEKDAVKYAAYARPGQWAVEAAAVLSPGEADELVGAVFDLYAARRPRVAATLE